MMIEEPVKEAARRFSLRVLCRNSSVSDPPRQRGKRWPIVLTTIIGVIGRRIAGGVAMYNLGAMYRGQVTRQYLRLPLSWHHKHPSGQLLSNANADVEATWNIFAPLPMALGVVVMLVFGIVQMVIVDPWLAPMLLMKFAPLAMNFPCGLRHVPGDANHAAPVGHGACDRLPDPPNGIGRDLDATPIVVLFDRTHETEIAFLDKIEELQAQTGRGQ